MSRLSARPTRLESSANHNRAPESSANQNRTLRHRVVTRELSAANQNRVLRHPSRHYVTRKLSAPGGPFSALGSSRLAKAYLNT